MLNTDVLGYVSSFLNLEDYHCARVAHRDFENKKVGRRQRFAWSALRTVLHPIRQGWCAEKDCFNQRLYCIALEPQRTQVLSMYCGKCTHEFKKISSIVLLL